MIYPSNEIDACSKAEKLYNGFKISRGTTIINVLNYAKSKAKCCCHERNGHEIKTA